MTSSANLENLLDDNPSPDDVDFLEQQIYGYNVGHTAIRDGRELSIFMRDGEEIAAGLYGYTWGGVLDIRFLWVREDQRGSGLGKQLMEAAECEAIRRGCFQATLDTHSFQAPDFYAKLGYEIYGTLKDYPRGHSKHHLRKTRRS